MNHDRQDLQTSKDPATQKPSKVTPDSDLFSREVIMLASGLLILTLGIGGVLMYSEDESVRVKETKAVGRTQLSKAFTPQVAVATPLNEGTAKQLPVTKLVSLTEKSGSAQEIASFDDADVYFDFDRALLSEEAKNLIQKITDQFIGTKDWRATIHGHTDRIGSDAYNQALALRRGRAVKDYLISLGARESSIHIESFGAQHPVCTEDSDDCHQQNRRVHIRLFTGEPSPSLETPLVSEVVPVQPAISTSEEPPSSSPLTSETATTTALLSESSKDGGSINTEVSSDPLP